MSKNETIKLRAVTWLDAVFIAEVIELASDGIARIEWADTAAGTGRSPLAVGTEIYAGEDGDYGYRNCNEAETR